ncbi:MAG: hypothetical protein AMXMBFR64_04860 [Myxococcales bacterium]
MSDCTSMRDSDLEAEEARRAGVRFGTLPTVRDLPTVEWLRGEASYRRRRAQDLVTVLANVGKEREQLLLEAERLEAGAKALQALMDGGPPASVVTVAARGEEAAEPLPPPLPPVPQQGRRGLPVAVTSPPEPGRRAATPKPGTDPASRAAVAALVERGACIDEIVEARGVTRSAVEQMLRHYGARPRYADQPKGVGPAPHIGQLLDADAERAPETFPCPKCGRPCTGQHRAHLIRCGWAAKHAKGQALVRQLLDAGWSVSEILAGTGLTRGQCDQVAMGRRAPTPKERAALEAMRLCPIPTMPHRGTVRDPIVTTEEY